MKIKDHPQMRGKRLGGTWFEPTTKTSNLPHDLGEWSLIKTEYTPPRSGVKFFLMQAGNTGGAYLTVETSNFAHALSTKLKADCKGMTMKDIGEIEINF